MGFINSLIEESEADQEQGCKLNLVADCRLLFKFDHWENLTPIFAQIDSEILDKVEQRIDASEPQAHVEFYRALGELMESDDTIFRFLRELSIIDSDRILQSTHKYIPNEIIVVSNHFISGAPAILKLWALSKQSIEFGTSYPELIRLSLINGWNKKDFGVKPDMKFNRQNSANLLRVLFYNQSEWDLTAGQKEGLIKKFDTNTIQTVSDKRYLHNDQILQLVKGKILNCFPDLEYRR